MNHFILAYFLDATPSYMRDPTVPSKIVKLYSQEMLNNSTFIFVLRDPIDRLFSEYSHYKNNDRGRLSKYSFDEFVTKAIEIWQNCTIGDGRSYSTCWFYMRYTISYNAFFSVVSSMYGEQLKYWLQATETDLDDMINGINNMKDDVSLEERKVLLYNRRAPLAHKTNTNSDLKQEVWKTSKKGTKYIPKKSFLIISLKEYALDRNHIRFDILKHIFKRAGMKRSLRKLQAFVNKFLPVIEKHGIKTQADLIDYFKKNKGKDDKDFDAQLNPFHNYKHMNIDEIMYSPRTNIQSHQHNLSLVMSPETLQRLVDFYKPYQLSFENVLINNQLKIFPPMSEFSIRRGKLWVNRNNKRKS